MKTMLLGALVATLVVFSGDRSLAQIDAAGRGTVFISAQSAYTVTVMRNGGLLGTFSFPKGTQLSVVDEHKHPTHLGDGRFEFHGTFELRALTAQDLAAQHPANGTPGAEIMSHAPVVLTGRGVDVLVEKVTEQ